MKKLFVIATTALALSVPCVALAQFGNVLKNINIGKSSSDSGGDIGAQQNQLAQTYAKAGREVLVANNHLASALGLKVETINASATSDALTMSEIEAQDKAISSNAAAVAAALKSGATLKDEKAKVEYGKGLLALAIGLKQYMSMDKAAKNFASSMTSISPTQIGAIQTGAYIVKTLPGNVSNLTGSLQNAVDFAKTNGVEIPKDATSLL